MDVVVVCLTSIEPEIKPSTYTNYLDYLNAYVLSTLGQRKLQDVQVPTLNALYRHLLGSGRRKRDTNTLMYEHWSARQAAGQTATPREIAVRCKVSIHAARKAVTHYRQGRLPRQTALGPRAQDG